MTSLPRPAADLGAGQAEAVICRLQGLYPRLIDLSLDRVVRLLGLLGEPQLALPPVFHVAGTNGKGSTCAFARAIGEAAGWRVHVLTSPHLIELREQFRLGGQLVSSGVLADTLSEVEFVNGGAPITAFEALVATGYVLCARDPADLCIVEVGMGGRSDATNVIPQPAACAITSISFDHQEFLGGTLERIAWEKAGIMKPGRPVVTGYQGPDVMAVLRGCASDAGASLLVRGEDWQITPGTDGVKFEDGQGRLSLPVPGLAGAHQVENAGIAVAALRASGLDLEEAAYGGIAEASWPARLQRLDGRLSNLLPKSFELFLDGGHNAGAGRALAEQLKRWSDRPTHLVVGMKQGKDAYGFLQPLLPHAATIWAVHEPGQDLAMPLDMVIAASGGVARPGPDVAGALRQISGPPGRVLICGSLYLAGEVLKAESVMSSRDD